MPNLTPMQYMDLYAGINAEATRIADYHRRWCYYTGDHPDSLIVTPGKRNDNIKKNLCRAIVNLSVSFVWGSGWKISARDEPAESDNNIWLTDFTKSIKFPQRARHALKNASIYGQAYVQIGKSPSQLYPGEIPNGEYPQLSIPDPVEMSVIWDPEDITVVMGYERKYLVPVDKGMEVRIVKVLRTPTGWVIEKYRWRDPVLSTMPLPLMGVEWGNPILEKLSSEPWPFPWSPIADFVNLEVPGEYYGESDLTDDVLSLQDGLNKATTDRGRILNFHAHPLTVGEGVKLRAGETGPDKFLQIPKGAKVYNVEMQSNLDASRQFEEDLRRDIWTISRTVDPDILSQVKGDRVTNHRVRMIFLHMLQKAQEKLEIVLPFFELTLERAAQMAGKTLRVKIEPGEMIPASQPEEAAIVQSDIAAGLVSRETSSEIRGYNWAIEEPRIQAELLQRLELEAKYGKAVGDDPASQAEPQLNIVDIGRNLNRSTGA